MSPSDLTTFLANPDCLKHVHAMLTDFHLLRDAKEQLTSGSSAPELTFTRNGSDIAYILQKDATGEMFEAVFEVQGVLMDFDLPPVTDKNQLMPKPAWAKQAVKICGLGSQIFDSAIRGLRTLECRIAALYKVGAVQEWSPSAIGEWPSLDFATRYVTPHAFAKGQHAVPFPKDVDPQGILLKTTSPVGIHLEDNHVLYYEACHIEKNKVVYQPVDPAVIRIGQIVQLQVAFTSVPLWGKKGQHQLACKLRSLVILDRNVQEAFQLSMHAHMQRTMTMHIPAVPKRRVGYAMTTVKRGKTRDSSTGSSSPMAVEQDMAGLSLAQDKENSPVFV